MDACTGQKKSSNAPEPQLWAVMFHLTNGNLTHVLCKSSTHSSKHHCPCNLYTNPQTTDCQYDIQTWFRQLVSLIHCHYGGVGKRGQLKKEGIFWLTVSVHPVRLGAGMQNSSHHDNLKMREREREWERVDMNVVHWPPFLPLLCQTCTLWDVLPYSGLWLIVSVSTTADTEAAFTDFHGILVALWLNEELWDYAAQ